MLRGVLLCKNETVRPLVSSPAYLLTRPELMRALECADPQESQRLLDEVLYERAQSDLEDKRRTALRRSGARGKEARADEIKAEEALAEAKKRLKACIITDDWSLRATELLHEVQAVLEVVSGVVRVRQRYR